MNISCAKNNCRCIHLQGELDTLDKRAGRALSKAVSGSPCKRIQPKLLNVQVTKGGRKKKKNPLASRITFDVYNCKVSLICYWRERIVTFPKQYRAHFVNVYVESYLALNMRNGTTRNLE
jgi:hypothetical protein